VRDDSQSLDDVEPAAAVTSKSKAALRLNTKTRASTGTKPKHSFPVPIDEPVEALPSLISSSSLQDFSQDGTDHEQTSDVGTQDPWRRQGQKKRDLGQESTEDEGLYYKEVPSMTLRDILLGADTTQFHLLGTLSFSQYPQYVQLLICSFMQRMILSNWVMSPLVGIMQISRRRSWSSWSICTSLISP